MGTGVQVGRASEPSPEGKKAPEVVGVVMELLNMIEQHKRIVLSSPFVLAVVLWVAYAIGGSELRKVLDFMSPGHFLGH